MRLPRVRFTIRSLLIGVALVGLNLAAALATANTGGNWPRSRLFAGRTVGGEFREVDDRHEYGVGCLYAGPFVASDRRGVAHLTEVWRVPLPATRLQVWSPLIASVSVTILVVILSRWKRGGLLGDVASDDGQRRTGRSSLWTAARWSLLTLSLVALNLAGAVHRPGFKLYEHDAAHPPSPEHQKGLAWVRSFRWSESDRRCHRYTLTFVGDLNPARRIIVAGYETDPITECHRMEYHDLFVGAPKVLNVEVDGTLVERCPMERGEHTAYHEDESRLPPAIFQDSPDGEATIDFRSDGSILGYAGRAGKMLTRPRLIRTPTFSSLEMHGPLVASVAITGLVLVAVFRCLGPRQRRALCIVLALAGLNAAAAFVSHRVGEPPRLLSQLETVREEPGKSHLVRREEYYSDGSLLVYTRENTAPSWQHAHIEKPGRSPTLQGIWWPVIASASITILVLGIWWHWASRRRARPVGASNGDDRPGVIPESR